MSVRSKVVKPAVEITHATSSGESGSDGKDWLERGDHPLFNDLILETLFEFVRRFDLKSCRVVSKKWNVRTIPHMRATFRVTVHGNQFTEQNDSEENEDTRRIGDFVELFNLNELGIPFAKFQLGPFCTTDGVGKQFFGICGKTATEIDLNGWKCVYMIEDVSELLRASPNIQCLTLPFNLASRSGSIVKLFPDSVPPLPYLNRITFRPDRERKGLKFCPTLIEELFSANPSISDIVVRDIFPEATTEEENVIGIGAVLNAIEKLGIESSIQSIHLSWSKTVHAEQLRRMGEKKMGLKLKNLRLNAVRFGIDYGSTIQIQLATCFKDSLQHFSVAQVVNNNLMDFPIVPLLKSLTFYKLTDLDPVSTNLNKRFPVLERFKLCQEYRSENSTRFFSKFESCPTVKSLHVSNSIMRPHTIHAITRVFPSLTQLSLTLTDRGTGVESLREMWSHLTGLESFTVQVYIEITEDLELDSVFTGIPTQALKVLAHVVKDFDKITVEEKRETISKLRNEHYSLPSIQNLTKLKRLDLTVSGGASWTRGKYLSDLTAYLAFYSMNQLNHLNIRGCLFTKTSCEMLRKEKELDTWGFRNSLLKHIIPPFPVDN